LKLNDIREVEGERMLRSSDNTTISRTSISARSEENVNHKTDRNRNHGQEVAAKKKFFFLNYTFN
jgi:hypothetical protein